jgi:high affinity sulfate transporter 1
MEIQEQEQETGFRRYIPILTWLPKYQRQWLRTDIIAGLTIMALLVPEGMAYAELAGMPPQTAFYAAPVGLILYGIFGSSRQLVVAVSAAVAVMSFSIVSGLVPVGSPEFITLTAALAILAGLVALLAGLLRLGRIAQFFSKSVLVGFVSGLALVIMIKQIPKLFGLEPVDGNFWERVIELARELPETHFLTLTVGLSSLILMIFLERRFKRIPAALIVMIYGIAVVSVFNLAEQGVHIIGGIPAGLAPPKIPDISLQAWLTLIPGALAITLVIFSEAVGPARSFASKHHYEIDENQDLIGIGMANLGAGLFQGFSIGASLSKSAANDAAGGRTQIAGITAAIFTALVALFFTPLFFNLPEAALAAIVIVAVSGMIKIKDFRRLYRLRRVEFWLAFITFLGVLTFEEVIAGLLLGVLLSLLALIGRTSQPKLSVLGRIPGTLLYRSSVNFPAAIRDRGLLVVRPDEGIFFANAAGLRQAIRRQVANADPLPRTTILDVEMTNELDVPSVEVLEKLHEEHLALGIQFKLAGLHSPVQKMLDTSGLTAVIGPKNIHATVLEAVLSYTAENFDRIRDEFTEDDIETLINRIDMLTEIFGHASESVSEEHQEGVSNVINRLEVARSRLEDGGSEEIAGRRKAI